MISRWIEIWEKVIVHCTVKPEGRDVDGPLCGDEGEEVLHHHEACSQETGIMLPLQVNESQSWMSSEKVSKWAALVNGDGLVGELSGVLIELKECHDDNELPVFCAAILIVDMASPVSTQASSMTRGYSNESSPDEVFFKDSVSGIEANHPQFINDVYITRQELLDNLPRTLFSNQNLLREDRSFVCILNQGSYDFIVAAFAVLALGGAVVPLSPNILPEEAIYLMNECQSTMLMAGSSAFSHAADIQRYAASQQQDIQIQSISIQTSLQAVQVTIDESMAISSERPSFISFTSGTSGVPKGVVFARRYLDLRYKPLGPGAFINCTSLWTIGAVRLIKQTLLARRIEIMPSDPSVLWERLRNGGAEFLAAVPPVWQNMMNHYQQHLGHLPAVQREEYLSGLRGLRTSRVNGGTLISSRLQFWKNLGKPLELCYSATELGMLCLVTGDGASAHRNNYLGRPLRGVTIKLSEGTHGEMLIKTPKLFLRYLNNPEATKAVLTDDGFYRTGDLVSCEGNEYYFHGRASTDFIKYHGYQVPIMTVEKQLNDLPGVKEGHILAMPDERCGYRVAALVQLGTGGDAETQPATLDLPSLRTQLVEKVPTFMLPTAFRLLQADETIPRTVSGKIIRRDATKQFFPVGEDGLCSAPDVQLWLAQPSMCQTNGARARAWDWAGAPMG
ncbi:NRPS-like protein biosynthetic cluster [Penicillium robsamsonii]|uniref:NRPS-like protein biosynthetic cluster n=1 Tax=Penicillium robsamsonii TaxID=1792511 RepID=UPI0025467A5F|nr:NRPS-like protein biosynthetic cluster [Penicillium robsamsonii]KAJ5835714.1 NRPS-like protein biosynthetic cluster [Penicillium robsamsonii]